MLEAETLYGLYFESAQLTGANIQPLYPYHSMKLLAVVLYMEDYERNVDLFAVPITVQIVISIILLFICLATLVLWFIREKLERRHNSLVSSFMESLVPFIGGGVIRMQHKLERWFFSVLCMSAFFIVAVLVGDILDSIVRIQTQRISTFQELAKADMPIYISTSLAMHGDEIRVKLERKMSPNINYQGVGHEPMGRNFSHAIIFEEFMAVLLIPMIKFMYPDYVFDVLVESLGMIFQEILMRWQFYR